MISAGITDEARRYAGSNEDASDEGRICFCDEGELDNSGAGSVAGEDAAITIGKGRRGWHRWLLDECWRDHRRGSAGGQV